MAHESVQSERARLEEAEHHHRILSEVSRLLLDYVGSDEVEPLRRMVHKVSDELGDWCVFALVQEDGLLKTVASHHTDPRQRELEQRLNQIRRPRRWDEGPPQFNALLQKKPVVMSQITDEALRLAHPDPTVYELLKQTGIASGGIVPVFDGPDPMGTLTLVSTRAGRHYDESDLDFAFSLAGRAAIAVRNAHLVRDLALERDRQRSARVEAERRTAELRAVFNADPNGIALFDSTGRLQFASPRLEEIFGLPLGTLLGHGWEDIYRRKLAQVVSTNREQLFQRVRQIFEDPHASTMDELELERPRHRWVTRHAVPVRAGGEYLGRLVIYTDVSEQRELDRQRADFLTVAAHELRTPLTPLSMYLQNIERKLSRGNPVEPELAVKARRQVGRLSKLVEDLLDLSRLESRRMQLAQERVDLNDLAEQVVGDFRTDARNHELIFRREEPAKVVVGDRPRLEQVLVNLLQNALKYSPNGGQILVRVESHDGEARISVTDPGIGIPRDEQARLFQRFFRAANATTRNYSGLGIGLYVSNEIVQRHHGRFEVTSELGAGSTFTVVLPLAPGETAQQRRRVLLVDDDPEILEATGQLLREWGYLVDEARDGTAALSLARASKPDLVLVDLMMPVMDGWTLVTRLRDEKLAHDVPLVVFSADRDAREKAKRLNADAALRKPFELQELQDVVERLLAQKPAA